jgi:hypothetical protein
MSQAVTQTITNRRRFSMFKHADDLALIGASRRFAVQRQAVEAMHDQYHPFDPPAALLQAMHEALDNAREEVAAIPAATRAGIRAKADVLRATLDDFADEDCADLTRSLANDCAAI